MFSIVLLVFGVVCGATAVLMIKASQLHPAVLATHRLLLAALLLSPLYFHLAGKHRATYSVRHLRLVFLPALTLALHFITWAQGAKLTQAANASLIVNLVPVAMPFLLYFTAREVITRNEVLGTLVALAGVVLLTASDVTISPKYLQGDLICFGSMILVAFYLVQGRVSRQFPSIWLYLVPLYAIAGAICFLISLLVADPLSRHAPRDYLLSLGLAAVPTVMGHSIMNLSMQRLRGQIVSVVNLTQFLFAGALAYLLFGEEPHRVFYIAGALVVSGAVIVIRAMPAQSVAEPDSDEAEVATT
jgi:drug/metabolite transporter (DMT)-like permease